MPVRRSLYLVLLAAGVAIAAVPAPALSQIRPGRLGIGDSVMLGAKVDMQHRGFGIVDAVQSRQFDDVTGVVNHWKRLGRLPKNVLIGLGTNGTIDLADCYAAVHAAGPGRKVFLVNLKVPRVYRVADNVQLARCAGHFSNVYLIDWFHHSVGHPGWFYRDGFHLRPSGRSAYAAFMSQQIAAHN
jgi:hypothetical protein